MQEITHSYHRSEAPSPEIWGLFRSEAVAGLARARWCWVWWTARLAMTDYARNHAQLSQVRGTFAGDLGPLQIGRGGGAGAGPVVLGLVDCSSRDDGLCKKSRTVITGQRHLRRRSGASSQCFP